MKDQRVRVEEPDHSESVSANKTVQYLSRSTQGIGVHHGVHVKFVVLLGTASRRQNVLLWEEEFTSRRSTVELSSIAIEMRS